MRWECVECGGLVDAHRRPTVCPHCGIGGSQFVDARWEPGQGATDESFSDAWLDYGMNWSDGRPLDGSYAGGGFPA